MTFLLGFALCFLSIFLILLVLVQRGRGGGLVGALGGPGGQSAFGSKAGDTFTWITIGTAALWGLLCIASVLWAKSQQRFGGPLGAEEADIAIEDPTPGAAEGGLGGGAAAPGAVDMGTDLPPGLGDLEIPPEAPPAADDAEDTDAGAEAATEPAAEPAPANDENP